jgi:hypothetical protein
VTTNPCLLPAAEVARRLGIASATFARLVEAHGILPDDHVRAGALRPPGPVYRETRLPEFRAKLGCGGQRLTAVECRTDFNPQGTPRPTEKNRALLAKHGLAT